ncbi:MAG: DUF6600 domain-containing protein [Thermoanaerobaculia bacterium]
MTTETTNFTGSTRTAWTLAAALLLASPAVSSVATSGAPAAPAMGAEGLQDGAPLSDERSSYSFLRTLEGSATVASAGEGVSGALEVRQPLLTGDQVRVGQRSRIEITLADHNRLHLDADTGVVLERLAFSGDREERVTVLRLEGGELLLEVADEALGDELPQVVTANATIYVQEPGQYRIEAGVEENGESWTRVVTRRGYAEIVTDRGSSVVREGEAMLAQGDRSARLELAAADSLDALERWSAGLADQALSTSRSARYVEPHLAYDSAPLDEAGDWVEYESVRYWRPYVSSGWRPYWQGRWDWTPSGYTWISYEPWGAVPYHYGRWCSLPGYGWAWRPGAVYSPAWVYWNWTSGWAGWVPMGYYSQFYNPWHGDGFRYGVYGWSGGGWGIYSDWNFAPVHCFRDRNFRGHVRTGRDFQHESRLSEPPRGLVTTDTRDFRPDRIDRTEDLIHKIDQRNRQNVGQDLPDITDFVGRKGRLPTDIARVLVPEGPKGPAFGGTGSGGKDRGLIRDIGTPPKVAETPGWQQREPPKAGGGERSRGYGSTDRAAGIQKPTMTGGSGSKNSGGKSGGGDTTVLIQPRPGTTKGGRPVDSGVASPGKVRTPPPSPAAPGTKGRAPGTEPPYESNRQLWKEKGGESAPVQRVVGSVRRPAPGGEARAPSTPGKSAWVDGTKGTVRSLPPTTHSTPPGGRSTTAPASPADGGSKYISRPQPSRPSQPSQRYDQGARDSQPAKPAPGYGRNTPGAPSGSGGSNYGKSGPGTQGTQSTPRYGNGGSAAQRSPSNPGYSKGSSGSQGAPGPGRGGSGTQSPQSSPSYGKGSPGPQTSPSRREAPGAGQGSASTSRSQGSQSSGKTSSPSQGGQRSQPAGKSSASSSGTKSRSSSPPPPPPESKKDDGRHR